MIHPLASEATVSGAWGWLSVVAPGGGVGGVLLSLSPARAAHHDRGLSTYVHPSNEVRGGAVIVSLLSGPSPGLVAHRLSPTNHQPSTRRECVNTNMTGPNYEGFASLLQAAAQGGCDVTILISDSRGRIGDLTIQREGDGWTFSQELHHRPMDPDGALWGLANMNAALLGGGQ